MPCFTDRTPDIRPRGWCSPNFLQHIEPEIEVTGLKQARWIEVERDIEAAVRHLGCRKELFNDPDLRTSGWEAP